MRKNNPIKIQKNSSEILQKNTAKNKPKIRGNSRTMEWLNLPKKAQKEFRENFIAMNLDFMQFTCYQISHILQNMKNFIGLTGEIDTDNSNTEHNKDKNISVTYWQTKNWHAYSIFFHSPGFSPLMVASIEVYDIEKIQLLKTEWKIVFYGAYFVFNEILEEEAPSVIQLYKSIELSMSYNFHVQKDKNWKLIQKPLYKRTRVDIATDVGVEMSKKWITQYIRPHKNSKHVPKPYSYDPITETFQSVGYIPRLKQGIGIRVYNKVKNIRDIKKGAWHPTHGTEINPIVTRIEVVYSWDFAQNTINELFDYTKFRILGDEKVQFKPKIRPKSEYSPLSAYEYFKRYAKNHGKNLREVLDDIMMITITEEKKDLF